MNFFFNDDQHYHLQKYWPFVLHKQISDEFRSVSFDLALRKKQNNFQSTSQQIIGERNKLTL